MKQNLTELKGKKINRTTIIIEDLNIPLSVTCRTRQKSNKEIEDANDPIQQLDLIDLPKTFHTSTEEYTLFSSANMEHSIA